MPDPEKILTTIRRAATLFRATPARSGGLISLSPPIASDVLVVGDLHGNIPAMRRVLDTAALAQNPQRHLVLQELIHGRWFYPEEKGDRSHQLVDLVCALKCQFPDRVHLILGNHELSELTGRAIGKNGVPLNALFRQGITTAYGAKSGDVYAAYLALFASLPLAVRTENRVFLCHSIPDAIDLDTFDPAVFTRNTWEPGETKRHGSVYSLTWGRDTAPETLDRFATMVDADWFITGHQPCDQGFRQANHRQIIIDGTDPFPTSCLFPVDQPVTMEMLLKGIRSLAAVS